MEFGLIFPTAEIGTDPAVIRDYAQAAEDLGYAHIMAYDHVVGAPHEGRDPPLDGPYTENDPFHEPVTLLAWLAAITKRVRIATGILILPQRQTVLVAKQVAQLDLLSGGRMLLGVGTGWNPVEYEALGMPFKERGALLDEQVTLLRKLWSEPVVDFTGRYHRVDRAGINPLPPKPIEIWMGGFGRNPVERAARTGDGYVFGGHPKGPEFALHLIEKLHEAGRDPATFGMDATIKLHEGPDAWHKGAETWRALGARYLSLNTMGLPGLHNGGPRLGSPREHIDAITRFMAEMRGYVG
jgi:probable F420-dependent oxidoreductase